MIKEKNKRPWGGFGYVVLIVVIILVAYFIVLPLGLQVRDTLQKLNDAFSHK